MSASFTALFLTKESRAKLLERFAPQFPDIKLDHLTIQYPAHDDRSLFDPQSICVTGYITDGNGLEALIAEVDGQQFRNDGQPWHITLSCDSARRVPDNLKLDDDDADQVYKPKHSNTLIKHALNHTKPYDIEHLETPITISAKPKFIGPKSGFQSSPESPEP